MDVKDVCRASRPCQVRLNKLKNPRCPWCGARQHVIIWSLHDYIPSWYSWNIAGFDVNNKQPLTKPRAVTDIYGGWFVPFRLFVISRRHNEGAITKRRKDESEKTKRRKRKDEKTKAKRRKRKDEKTKAKRRKDESEKTKAKRRKRKDEKTKAKRRKDESEKTKAKRRKRKDEKTKAKRR